MGRRIPMWQILLVLLVLMLTLAWTILGTEGYVHIPLVISAIFGAIIAIANGFKWSYIEKGIINNIGRSMQAILILLTVGMLIATWIAAGIVPAMIYYGLMILSPGIFLVATCLICAIVALATGSSWTTAGTVGIALIGVGAGLGISLPMAAGAIISGAYFGDKMSPLSDTTNLAPAMAGSTLFDHVRHMIFTTGPSLIISLIIYGVLGMGHAGQNVDLSGVTVIMDGLKENFYISPILIIPPLLVIAMVIFKVPALPGLIGGVILGVICAVAFQGANLGELVTITAYEGFVSETGNEFIDSLLSRGGLSSMYYTVGLIMCAMCIGGVLDSTDMLKILCESLLKLAKGTGSLVVITIITCIGVNIAASDQYLSIVLPGRMYKTAYEDRRLKNKNLSRVLEDSGTLTSPLVPWNTCGTYQATTLGVATFAYAPYCFLNIINPLVSIFYGFTGITMEKMTDEEYNACIRQRELDAELALKSME
ncbi:Na+/H+ antiporter NhaC [Sinanaerobacter chloroacetimidivorans]|jgi:NhaC family Na+:H+ antiporter|uniref:Na+/H+ antiporter NhaC n=1 Tax=Sinanaerobacter chloroacetimidivorans TaxID=2818044 RepID=A0A8J7W7V2_9FIRM|nr:Na+/H+ antiporter NhaC [Sinanaerobacter chloroacetimidivorans]MBR0600633.1 Na+/H+ antiporter NhaC [Sinanaerobacter chloroacetimidivorans]